MVLMHCDMRALCSHLLDCIFLAVALGAAQLLAELVVLSLTPGGKELGVVTGSLLVSELRMQQMEALVEVRAKIRSAIGANYLLIFQYHSYRKMTHDRGRRRREYKCRYGFGAGRNLECGEIAVPSFRNEPLPPGSDFALQVLGPTIFASL
jgi:hypothetical protein